MRYFFRSSFIFIALSLLANVSIGTVENQQQCLRRLKGDILDLSVYEGKLIIVSGPSGVGKDTVVQGAMNGNENLMFSVSATTRAPRPGEEHGKDYFFITQEEFEAMISRGEFFEHAQYTGNYYGTPMPFVVESLSAGRDVVLVIDVQGALQIQDMTRGAVSIFIAPPSVEVLEARLRGRGTEEESVVQKRLQQAQIELGFQDRYTHVVVNDDLDIAIQEVLGIVGE